MIIWLYTVIEIYWQIKSGVLLIFQNVLYSSNILLIKIVNNIDLLHNDISIEFSYE